jgi:pyruvate,water dikinase
VLDVRGDDALLEAVRTCWNSALEDRVTSYAGGRTVQLAVLVQPMVPATAAGVAFTADPVTGERGCVLIDAVVGTGERLASGAATPDRWVVRDGDVHPRSAPKAALEERHVRASPTWRGGWRPSWVAHRTSSGRWPGTSSSCSRLGR